MISTGSIRWLAAAVAAHAVVGGALAFVPADLPSGAGRSGVELLLETPPEQPRPLMLVASMPKPKPPEPTPPAATPPPKSDDPSPLALDKGALRELEAERGRLLARLEQERSTLGTPPKMPNTDSPPSETPNSKGTVRDLELGGQPREVVDEVMQRYRLRVSERYVPARSVQTYLSSAADGRGHFTASPFREAGIYQVFELSRESVAAMSRLEEAELHARRLDPEKTRVTLVKFGIVRNKLGQHDLGVLDFQWERVE